MTDKERISEDLIELAKLEPVPFKAAAYLTAASNVLKHRGANWSEVPGVGEKIAEKIDELLRTGKMSKLEKLREQAKKREKKKDNKYVGPEFAKELGEKLEQFGMMFELAGSYRRGKKLISDVDVLVLKVPSGPYSPGETDAVRAFVERGGGLLLLGEHTSVYGSGVYLNQLAERLGLGCRFRYDCAFGVDSVFEQHYVPPVVPHPVIHLASA